MVEASIAEGATTGWVGGWEETGAVLGALNWVVVARPRLKGEDPVCWSFCSITRLTAKADSGRSLVRRLRQLSSRETNSGGRSWRNSVIGGN